MQWCRDAAIFRNILEPISPDRDCEVPSDLSSNLLPNLLRLHAYVTYLCTRTRTNDTYIHDVGTQRGDRRGEARH